VSSGLAGPAAVTEQVCSRLARTTGDLTAGGHVTGQVLLRITRPVTGYQDLVASTEPGTARRANTVALDW
jgi:hypothetical protein